MQIGWYFLMLNTKGLKASKATPTVTVTVLGVLLSTTQYNFKIIYCVTFWISHFYGATIPGITTFGISDTQQNQTQHNDTA